MKRYQRARDFGWMAIGTVVMLFALVLDRPLTAWARKTRGPQ